MLNKSSFRFSSIFLFALLLIANVTNTHAQDYQRTLRVSHSLSSEFGRVDAPVVVSWDSNADYVAITYRGYKNSIGTADCAGTGNNVPTSVLHSTCPPVGSATLEPGIEYSFQAVIVGGQAEGFDLKVECHPDEWFMQQHKPIFCPHTAPINTVFEMQQFENGMILRSRAEQPPRYLMLRGNDDGGFFSPVYPSSLTEDAATTTYGTPPQGVRRPTGEFGEVWAVAGATDTLGWATAPMVSHVGFYQTASFGSHSQSFYALPTAGDAIGISEGIGGSHWTLYGAPTAQVPQGGDCVIPDRGPWPPCATGGGSNASSTPTSTTPTTGDCTIPASGPWPACATAGNNPPANTADCVIPASGPWPACATAGNNPPANTADCVIPSAGAWPPCATRGGGTSAPQQSFSGSGLNFESAEFTRGREFHRERRITTVDGRALSFPISVYANRNRPARIADVELTGTGAASATNIAGKALRISSDARPNDNVTITFGTPIKLMRFDYAVRCSRDMGNRANVLSVKGMAIGGHVRQEAAPLATQFADDEQSDSVWYGGQIELRAFLADIHKLLFTIDPNQLGCNTVVIDNITCTQTSLNLPNSTICTASDGPVLPSPSAAECVIPERGPWPPCATGG